MPRKPKNPVSFSGLEDVNHHLPDRFRVGLLQSLIDKVYDTLSVIEVPVGKAVHVEFERDDEEYELSFHVITDDPELRNQITQLLQKIGV